MRRQQEAVHTCNTLMCRQAILLIQAFSLLSADKAIGYSAKNIAMHRALWNLLFVLQNSFFSQFYLFEFCFFKSSILILPLERVCSTVFFHVLQTSGLCLYPNISRRHYVDRISKIAHRLPHRRVVTAQLYFGVSDSFVVFMSISLLCYDLTSGSPLNMLELFERGHECCGIVY